MSVLVAVASRHGSTHDIAEAIASELRASGIEAEVRDVGAVTTVEGYDAVVLGSAVYGGSWLGDARAFVSQHGQVLKSAAKPVWMFSSGPIGPTPKPGSEINEIPGLMTATGAQEHHVFSGKLDPAELDLVERLVTRVVGAPKGDYRNWDEIRSWAGEIATSVKMQKEPASP